MQKVSLMNWRLSCDRVDKGSERNTVVAGWKQLVEDERGSDAEWLVFLYE